MGGPPPPDVMAPKMHGMHGLHIEGRIGHAEHDLETAIQVHGQDAFHMRKDHQRELMEKRQEHAMVARRIAHSDPKQVRSTVTCGGARVRCLTLRPPPLSLVAFV